MTVFLGGTCGNNHWRDDLINRVSVDGYDPSPLFNPVVDDWNDEAQRREEEAKKNADYHVYYIANPLQEGINISAYSMVEATMALYDRCDSTVVVFDDESIDNAHVKKAMRQCKRVLEDRFPDAKILGSFADLVQFCESVCWVRQ